MGNQVLQVLARGHSDNAYRQGGAKNKLEGRVPLLGEVLRYQYLPTIALTVYL